MEQSMNPMAYEDHLLQLLSATDQVLQMSLELYLKMTKEREKYSFIRRVGTFLSLGGISMVLATVLLMPGSDWSALSLGIFGLMNLTLGGVMRTGADFVEPFRAQKYAGPVQKLQIRFFIISQFTNALFNQLFDILRYLESREHPEEASSVRLLTIIANGSLSVPPAPHMTNWSQYFHIVTDSCTGLPTLITLDDPGLKSILRLTNVYRTVEFFLQASCGLIFFEPNFTQIFYQTWGPTAYLYGSCLAAVLIFTISDLMTVIINWTSVPKTEAQLLATIKKMRFDSIRCGWVISRMT